MKHFFSLLLLASFAGPGFSQAVTTNYVQRGDLQIFSLSNDEITQQVMVKNNLLEGELLEGNKAWLARYHNQDHSVYADGDYALSMMWTDWSAPGKTFNGDLQVSFSKKDYRYVKSDFKELDGGGKELELDFTPLNPDNTIQLRLTYQLLPGKFYTRRKISVIDTTLEKDWLQAIVCRRGLVEEPKVSAGGYQMREESSLSYQQVGGSTDDQRESVNLVKRGEFGQPCAADFSHGGVFFAVEYPAATNRLERKNENTLEINCSELIGKVVRNQWVESDWTVEGLAPNHYVKDWFFNYLPDIQVAPNRPYALYNSWYDLRSPMYPGVQPDHVMNEKNILHIIDLFKKNMIEPYGIHLDAFVLDDGWDNYESDWQMRTSTFPHGVKPIVDALNPLGTTLGLWFGPTGGYSFRMKRINWMKAHGYETVGHTPNDAMMDIAGPKYSALLEKRTTDFARQGVGYFKWDGIQFSSSEPGNGHPVGYLSRRAALESLFAKCKAVRAVNPHEFLNITSGTWMSPWWLQYANQIWMQGADYGFADVPSVNERDGAVTYKDFVLYDDFHNQDVWFPVGNLMTHGIIKGSLETVGGKDDPLDKFTDDVAFYFGRGVTMYELYISPDILNSGEWNALSKSLAWAKDRFDILNKTYMIGGDPTRGEAYGYVHFRADSGIIAIRNPQMESQQITMQLSPSQGLEASASNLVLERIYPTHWISPQLYSAGAAITVPLQGYEAAIYEVYPLQNARKPLLAGVTYESQEESASNWKIHVLKVEGAPKLLNPGKVGYLKIDGRRVNPVNFSLSGQDSNGPGISYKKHWEPGDIQTTLELPRSSVTSRFIVFLKPDSSFFGKAFPELALKVDGRDAKASLQQQSGSWATYSVVVSGGGSHHFDFHLISNSKVKTWQGTAAVWMSSQQKQRGWEVSALPSGQIPPKPMLPSPYGKGCLKTEIFIGNATLGL